MQYDSSNYEHASLLQNNSLSELLTSEFPGSPSTSYGWLLSEHLHKGRAENLGLSFWARASVLYFSFFAELSIGFAFLSAGQSSIFLFLLMTSYSFSSY